MMALHDGMAFYDRKYNKNSSVLCKYVVILVEFMQFVNIHETYYNLFSENLIQWLMCWPNADVLCCSHKACMWQRDKLGWGRRYSGMGEEDWGGRYGGSLCRHILTTPLSPGVGLP